MAKGPTKLQSITIILMIAFAAIFFVPMLFPGGSVLHTRTAETKSLYTAKQICRACKQYALDNGGKFPPSLGDLIPKYLPDASILASPLKPGEPIGYAYTPPGPGDADSPIAVVIEDKFAPPHERIVSYADTSARILYNQ
jgi:hypothetical protein